MLINTTKSIFYPMHIHHPTSYSIRPLNGKLGVPTDNHKSVGFPPYRKPTGSIDLIDHHSQPSV